MEHIETSESLLSEIQRVKKEAIRKGTLRKEKPLEQITPQETPYKLPNGWTWVRLGDYALKVTDYVASGSFASLKENVLITNEPNYAIMVKTADFANDFTKGLTYTDKQGYEFLSNSNLFGGELILSNIGSIGKVFIVPYLHRPMTLASNTVMVKVTNDELIKYLYYYYRSPLGQRMLRSISSGTSMMKFNKTQLKNTLVPVAPLFEQKHIVSLLEKTEMLIDHLQRQIQTLDTLIKARFVEMFREGVYPHMSLYDVITPGAGLSYGIIVPGDYFKEGCPMIRPSDYQNGKLDLRSVYRVNPEIEAKYSRTRLQGDEILVQVIGQPGQIIPATAECKGMNVTRNLAVVRPNRVIIDRTYLIEYMRTEKAQQYMTGSTKQSTLKQLPLSLLKSLEIPLPPIEQQSAFATFVSQVDISKATIQKALNEAQKILDSLMQQFFG